MPMAILNIKMVDGFSGMPANPIIPAVITNGIRFGSREIRIILIPRNNIHITPAIKNIASARLW